MFHGKHARISYYMVSTLGQCVTNSRFSLKLARMEQKDVLQAMRRDHAAELKLAAQRLEGTARHTEIIESPVLSEMTGHKILLKPENLQVTGSFKIRGAYNKIASLSDEELARGIVTASAGNHAQGVAYAARERGAKATILMPTITPPLKVDATKAYGAEVVLHGDVFDEAAAYAIELSKTEGMTYVPPFDDYEVLCGQGTIGMEILEDVPDVTDIVVPLGGGGLGAGVALAVKTFRPDVRVIGAIPEGSPAFRRSFAAGHVVSAEKVVTSAEGVAVRRPGDLTFALLNEFLDDLVEVSERDINEMILLMLEKHKMVVEAAGAVSLAALDHLNLRSRKFAEAPGEHVVVPILSGGNIDTVTIGAVIQKGMIARGRIMNFEVELPDTPGQLVKVATILAQARANVIALDHDQFKANGHYTNSVALGVTVETNGPDHIEQVLHMLAEAGYTPKRIY
ncbi:threonine dehydratase [Bifidobacterium sp. GSD1FS]|uniref:L-threonine dehydratase catabolic TdcB n=2 Tax=Bifidobacterium canis TaxID=2610880 RepID=A0A7K1J3H0_9BIFI|nr:threonine dehydratase [Bifidobacterium canis]